MEDDRFRTTRRMILVRGLLAPLITLMLVCAILVSFFAAYLRDQVETRLADIASNHRHMIDDFLNERACDLQFAASSCSMEEISSPNCLAELFLRQQTVAKAFLDLGLVDENGNHIAYVGPFDLAGKNYADTEWFQAVRDQGLYISDVFLGYRQVPHFVIAVRRNEGDRSWYLRATVDTANFNHLVESIRLGRTGEAYLVNRKGMFQTKRRSGGELMQPDPDFGSYLIDNEGVNSFSASSCSGQRHLYAAGPLSQTGWVLIVRQEVSDAYRPLAYTVLIAVGVIMAGGAAVGFMAYILASSLANRLTVAHLEKQEMKTQLIIAGKLAEVGEMSAGLAHEINNPLQVMMAEQMMIQDLLAEMENESQPADAERFRLLKDSIAQIDIQIKRCKRITQELLKFARKDETSIRPIRTQDFLPQVVRMIEHMAAVENVRISQDFPPGLPPIMSDPNQLQQVFLNLLNNALYATSGKLDGEIRITGSQEDGRINVSVADNGCGIAPDIMEKIFLPFYTTKPPGRGTGLGLSTAYGIVKGLGGDITVTSELNAGTVFTVRLPVRPCDDEEGRVPA